MVLRRFPALRSSSLTCRHSFEFVLSINQSLKEGTTYNHLKPSKTTYNHLQPPRKIQQPPTTTSKTSTTTSKQFLELRAQNVSHLQTTQLSGLSTTSVDNKGVITVILPHFFFYNLTFQIFKFSISLYYCGSIKYKQNDHEFRFVTSPRDWLYKGTIESKILGGGWGCVHFSNFIYVTYCHLACFRHLWLV